MMNPTYHLAKMRDLIEEYQPSRERSLAITKLDEFEMWLSRCKPTKEALQRDQAAPAFSRDTMSVHRDYYDKDGSYLRTENVVPAMGEADGVMYIDRPVFDVEYTWGVTFPDAHTAVCATEETARHLAAQNEGSTVVIRAYGETDWALAP